VANKKYQIFISSTFSDLQEERQLALKAILDLDHILSGMEAFPAIDMAQFEYIKKVIDERDYYLLIIGARYGSMDSGGVSFTEREFDYTVSKGKTVIALLHDDVQSLPRKNFDEDSTLEIKVDSFRDKVKNERMVRFLNNKDQLVSATMQAIIKAIVTYPASGWIRGDEVASDDVMKQYIQLRANYDDLNLKYAALVDRSKLEFTDLATFNEVFTIEYYFYANGIKFRVTYNATWGYILKIVGPNLYTPRTSDRILRDIKTHIEGLGPGGSFITVNQMHADTIRFQFHALGLLNVESTEVKGEGTQNSISLTQKGKAELLKLIAVRSGMPSVDQRSD
jgi:hypothetical protein